MSIYIHAYRVCIPSLNTEPMVYTEPVYRANAVYRGLLHTYTVMRPDNAFSALYNNTEQRANIRAKTQYLVFARILSFCPHTAFRPSPGFATYRE